MAVKALLEVNKSLVDIEFPAEDALAMKVRRLD